MAEPNFLMYKDRPLVRKGDTIYYGSSAEKYVIKLNILSEKKMGKEKIAEKVLVQLIANDESLTPEQQVQNSAEKNGLFEALDIGAIWLDRKLKKD